MRNYECLFIVNPNFDGDGISTVIEKVTGYVKEADAEVANIQHWGKRRLAYQIEKQQYGNYVLMHLNGEAPKITDLQRSLELDDSVLAYLTVRLDEMPEFDKVMIPEDESEDDRRGGRSRYEDSRSRDGGSYNRDTRGGARPDKAETTEAESATDEDDKADADIDTSPETEPDVEVEGEVVKDDSEPKQAEASASASEEAEPVEAADDEKADAGEDAESETADETGEDRDDVESVEDQDDAGEVEVEDKDEDEDEDKDKEVDDKKEEA